MKKLIGYGYTNSSGVATLDYDTDDDEIDGYTGTGAGLMNFRAEMHDDSTVVSQPSTIYDCMWYDEAKDGTGKHNDIWKTTNSTITRGTDYTTVTSSAQWGSAYLTGGTSITQQVDLLADNDIVCIEFDAIGNHILANQGFNIRWYDGSNHYFGCSQGEGHTLVYLSKTRQMMIVEGVRKYNTTISIPNAYLQSVADASGVDMKFANLKIYPVGSFPSI